MAGNQNSGRKRTASSGTGSSSGRKTVSAARTRSGSRKKQPVKKKEQGYTEPVVDEIKLIVVLAICILVLLSVFGLGGRAGDKVAYGLFGLFGSLTYALPFVLFIGIAFHMSNRGSRIAHIKIGAAVIFMFMLMALVAISDSGFDASGKITDSFLASAASHDGGGLIGFCLGGPLYTAFGRIGATVVFVCIMLISGVLVTGKGIFIRLGRVAAAVMMKLGEQFAAYREARAKERLRRQEEMDEQEALEDDMDEDTDDEDEVVYRSKRGRKRKKFAANIVMTEEQKVGTQSSDLKEIPAAAEASVETEKPVIMEESVVKEESAVTEEPAAIEESTAIEESSVIEESPVTENTKPFTKEHLDAFDHGQAIEPLHIKVPEFMKGGKLHESSMEARRPEYLSGISEKPHIKTSLTVEDLQLEIEGLDSEEPVTADQLKLDDEPSADVEESAAVRKQQPGVATEKSPAPARSRKKASDDHEPEAPLEIIEEEVEKYEFPPIELLEKGTAGGSQQSAAALKQTALKLQQTFESFGVGVQVTNVSCGPAVTRYELQPDQGVKVSRIVSLSDDIKLNLAVADIRIEAPIPGKAAVGIEVPNTHKEMVRLRDLLETDKARDMKSKLAFVVGKDIGGQPVVADIEKMPHLLIAGATGSGKSVCINTIIMSILYRADPNEVKMIMVDPKVVELNVYNNLPHLLIPVVTDPKKAAGALNWAVSTMMERYNKFAEIGAKDLKSYNARIEKVPYDSEHHKKMPQIVIIIDELADLMMVAQSEVEDAICRLAQLARAAGIHLVIATQRPSVNVITGLIKANVPSRIAFSVSSGVDSRTILDMNGAEKLLGNGDMLFYPQGYQKPVRVQGAFVSENEIGRVTDFIRAHMSSKPAYSEEIKSKIESSSISLSPSASNSDRDIYFAEAGRFVIEKEKASIGMLQRVYKIGFNRAARIMDQLCDAGVVGPEIGTKPRQIVMTMEEFEQFLSENQ